MCGRFTRKETIQQLAEQLGLKVIPPLRPRYNIAPSQLVACVRTHPDTQERECVELKWGLVPSWAKDPSIGNKLINAQGETVAEKPAFRKAFKNQRCLVLADGFYEWKREGKVKQPYYIRFKDHRPDCPNYDDILPENRIPFDSAQAAEDAGYTLAGNCPR